MSKLQSRGHARRWTPVVLASLAALVLATEAHADDLMPAPTDQVEVEAVLGAVEAAIESEAVVETALQAAEVEIPLAPAPDIAASTETGSAETPVTAVGAPPVQPVADSQPAEASAAAPEPQDEPTPVVHDTTEAAEAGDTGQYQPEDEASPAAEPAAGETTGPVPDEWTWVWSWNCTDPVQIPTPSGNSWTWIWNWNCGAETPTSDTISATQGAQYQPLPERYQDGNASTLFPTNFNASIRIFSPGDDGAVTQLNSALSTVTSLTTTIVQTVVQQTVEQTAQGLPAPGIVETVTRELPGIGFLDSIKANVGPTLDAGPGDTILADAGLLGRRAHAVATERPERSSEASGFGRLSATSTVAGAAPTLEARPAPAASRPERRAPAERRHSSLPPIVFSSPVVSAGGAAPGGTGGAFAAFLLALTAAYLVIPPGIRRRVRFAEARAPRGVDLGGDGRPG